MRKRLARWGRLLCSLCLALVLLSGSALAERPVVRVGYVDDPYLMTQNADGTYKGVLYNFLEMVAAYAGVEVVYVQGGISENYTRLANGEIDMLPGVMAGRTTHKGKPFILSKHSMSETTLQVAMRDHKAIDNGQKLRIGYYAPSVNLAPLRPWLEHQMEDYGPGYELVPFTVPGQPDKEYMAGNIDGVITNTANGTYTTLDFIRADNSDGSQYIITDYTPRYSDTFLTKVNFQNQTYQCIYCARGGNVSSGSYSCLTYGGDGRSLRFDHVAKMGDSGVVPVPALDTDYEFIVNGKTGVCKLNGANVYTMATSDDDTATAASALSFFVLYKMPLGGSVKLCAMLPILLVAIKNGPKWGFGTAFCHGLLQMLLSKQGSMEVLL